MKSWLSNLNMTRKLLVSPVAAVLFLIIFGIVTYVGFFKQKEALNDIFNIRFKHYQAIAGVVIDLKYVRANTTG
jgi:hypothetical protein